MSEPLASQLDKVPIMPRLVLINGAPGSGKSTLAQDLAQDRPLTLALDIDAIKHSLGRWADDLLASGLHSRRLTRAIAREQLSAGYDIVIGQYLARTQFIEELALLTEDLDARFCEFILELDASVLAERLAGRHSAPSRPEHAANNHLVGPEDAQVLVQSIEGLREARPDAVWIDARGSRAATLDKLRAVL